MRLLGALLVLAVGLAGCTGQFDVRQTEPLRIQLEGEPGSADLSGDVREREFVIVDADRTDDIRLDIDVQPRSGSPTVIVVVRDRDTGETLATREVDATNATSATMNVNVKGKDNVVVITQVQGGEALVNVAAHRAAATVATGDGDGGDGTDGGPGTGDRNGDRDAGRDVDRDAIVVVPLPVGDAGDGGNATNATGDDATEGGAADNADNAGNAGNATDAT